MRGGGGMGHMANLALAVGGARGHVPGGGMGLPPSSLAGGGGLSRLRTEESDTESQAEVEAGEEEGEEDFWS